MKRIRIILSVAILLVALSGCGNQKVQSNDIQTDNNTNVSDTTKDSTTDKGGNTTKTTDDAKEKSSDTTKKDNTNTNSGKTENSTSANENSKSTANYEIIEETYTKQNIKITYPQIRNLNDSKKSDLINKTLKDQALAVTNYYDLSNSNAILNVSYDIEFQNSDTLSIAYRGDFDSGSSAYPVSVFYTTNIDIKEGKSIRLKDYANANEIFNKLRKLGEVLNLGDTQELTISPKQYLSTIDDSTLKNLLANADFYESNGKIEFPEAFSYRKSDNIIIGIPVPHAVGDYAEFVVKK